MTFNSKLYLKKISTASLYEQLIIFKRHDTIILIPA